MKKLTRRQFIGTTSTVLGTPFLAGPLIGCGDGQANPSPEGGAAMATGTAVAVPWRYAICNEIMQDWDWERQCQYAAEVGYGALEVAPFTLANHVDDLSAAQRQQLKDTANAAGLEILGLHWLLVSPEGLHSTTSDEALWRRTWDYVAKLGDFCADLGGQVMIFGSPNQRSTVEGMTKEQAMENFAKGANSIADHLQNRGVQLLIEPLSSDQTDVVNTLAEAVQVVQMADHPAVSAMFDFHNTADETQPLDELVRAYYPEYIQHIQIQEMDGTYMGTGTAKTDYLPALRAFKELGYDGWVSLEVFDFEPGPETIATTSLETMKAMEAEL